MKLVRTSFFLFVLLTPVLAEAQSDTLFLGESAVISQRRSGAVIRSKKEGSTIVELNRIQSLPRILGSNDPLRVIQTFPGVSTNSEIESGVHIQGGELSHNYISIEGAPVYGNGHVLGLFSSFIPFHFQNMNFSTISGTRNRIGGEIIMSTSDSIARKVGLNVEMGMYVTQGTAIFPTGTKSSLTVSGRASYLNALYGNYLKISDMSCRYGLCDGNVSWILKPTGKDNLKMDFYVGNDRATIDADSYDIPLSMKWGNMVLSARWNHIEDNFTFNNSLYYSGYGLDVAPIESLSLPDLNTHLKSFGDCISFNFSTVSFGVELMYHDNAPFNRQSRNAKSANASELSLFQTVPFQFGDFGISMDMAEGLFWRYGEKPLFFLSPVLRLSYELYRYGRIEIRTGQKVQNLFQTGVSDTGFPTEYWIVSGNGIVPQKSRFASLLYDVSLLQGGYSLSLETYYKRLYNQIVYTGKFIDYYDNDYNLSNHLFQTDGRNYGTMVMLSKDTGKLTGWISYSFGRSLRAGDVPSSHERIHELNIVLSYQRSKWNCGTTVVAASGAPFTAPKCYYVLSNMIIPLYGDYNASRLPPYFRLDLSANYYFIRNSDKEFGINLSVYNATGHVNALGYRTQYEVEKRFFGNYPVAFSMEFMPSLSLYVKL